MSFRNYEEYKESGVEWLGEVPAHWVVTQIKYVAQINPSKSELKTIPLDTPVTFLPMESIGETGRLDMRNSKPLSEVISAGYTYLAENDVIIAKITPCFENGKGAIATGLLNGIAFATTEVVPFRCFKINNQYLYFLLSSSPFRKIAEGSMYGAGGQKRVSETFFANYKCCIPPTNEEQKQIVAFIDKETTKIDTLIDKQEQLITLLQEKRQAIISHAVTRGLNPDAKMKDSGIEWLGEIPEHWEPLRLKWVVHSVLTGGTPKKEAFEEGYVDWFTPGDFKDEVVLKSAQKQIAPEKATKGLQLFPPNSVLIVGIGATLGKVGLLKTKSAANQQINGVIPNNRVVPIYLTFSLLAQNAFMKQIANISTLSIMNQDKTKQIPLVVPPIDEQKRIIAFLNKETAKIDTLIEKCKTAIELLKERRTALISAAVTGKIDVRNVG